MTEFEDHGLGRVPGLQDFLGREPFAEASLLLLEIRKQSFLESTDATMALDNGYLRPHPSRILESRQLLRYRPA